jgi:hypothetical protein
VWPPSPDHIYIYIYIYIFGGVSFVSGRARQQKVSHPRAIFSVHLAPDYLESAAKGLSRSCSRTLKFVLQFCFVFLFSVVKTNCYIFVFSDLGGSGWICMDLGGSG